MQYGIRLMKQYANDRYVVGGRWKVIINDDDKMMMMPIRMRTMKVMTMMMAAIIVSVTTIPTTAVMITMIRAPKHHRHYHNCLHGMVFFFADRECQLAVPAVQ